MGLSHPTVMIFSPQVDKTKVRISQTLKRNLQKQQATWGGSTSIKKHVSGTASSVAFTPLQGRSNTKCSSKLIPISDGSIPKVWESELIGNRF